MTRMRHNGIPPRQSWEKVNWVMLNPPPVVVDDCRRGYRRSADAAASPRRVQRSGRGEPLSASGYQPCSAVWRQPDPIGALTDSIIAAAAAAGTTVVAAWGANAPRERTAAVSALLMAAHRAGDRCGRRRLPALGHTKSGAPRHPLYVRADTSPVALERRSIL